MFGRGYFGAGFFGPGYFGDGGPAVPSGASAAQVWAYVLPNGKSAAQNLTEINAAMRVLLAVAAGRTEITALGGGAAEVIFREMLGTDIVVRANMQGSERTDVEIDP